MDTKTIIETAEEHLIHTYNRYQIVLDKGDGVHLYDTDGKEYLDFGAGIAVFALGYNNKEYNDALKAQIDKLIHTSNYFYNEPAVEAATALTKASGMDSRGSSGADPRRGDRGHHHGPEALPERPARQGVRSADHPEHQACLFALEFENSRFNPASRPEIGPCVGTRQPKKENERLLFENQRT